MSLEITCTYYDNLQKNIEVLNNTQENLQQVNVRLEPAPGALGTIAGLIPKIPPFQSRSVSLTFPCIYRLSVENMPRRFTVYAKAGKLEESRNYAFNTDFYAKEYLKYIPRRPDGLERYNIGFYGVPGVGKSETINTILTAVKSSDEVVRHFDTSKGNGHETKQTDKVELGSVFPVNLWNCPGHRPQELDPHQLENTVTGLHPSGFNINHTVTPDVLDMARETRDKRRWNAAAVVVSVESLQNEIETEESKNLFHDLKLFVTNPVVVVTHLDLVEDYSGPLDRTSNGVRKFIKRVSNEFNISPSQIFPMVNYFETIERDFDIDRNALKLLRYMLMSAQNQVSSSKNHSTMKYDFDN